MVSADNLHLAFPLLYVPTNLVAKGLGGSGDHQPPKRYHLGATQDYFPQSDCASCEDIHRVNLL
jgi:hypothetical protein